MAFKIFFYRPNLDAELDTNPHVDWRADPHQLQTCISTHTSQFIHVNGVKLERGRDNLYGYLRTGDVITVFQPLPGADPDTMTARERERLMFRVEIFAGQGQERRGEGDFFQVLDMGPKAKERGEKRSREGSKGSEASKGSKASKTSKMSPGHGVGHHQKAPAAPGGDEEDRGSGKGGARHSRPGGGHGSRTSGAREQAKDGGK
ncbi:MAG: hypothetical protein Q9196_007449 [Gyalolechia fulgens]